MSTPRGEPKCESQSDPPAEDLAWRGRWTLFAVLPLMVVAAATGLAITPLRESLWASSNRPEPRQIRAELNAALDQVYRSFELDDEAATYDRIAQSVTGDAIRDIYLEVRRSLLDEDGGRVSIDRVRVGTIGEIEWQPDGGCQVDATWVVRGTVAHHGHSHERQNRYRARIALLPDAIAWKIRSIDITEHEREW